MKENSRINGVSLCTAIFVPWKANCFSRPLLALLVCASDPGVWRPEMTLVQSMALNNESQR